jgi:hypothetical protein
MKVFIVLVQWPFLDLAIWKVFRSREVAEAKIAERSDDGDYTIEEHEVV